MGCKVAGCICGSFSKDAGWLVGGSVCTSEISAKDQMGSGDQLWSRELGTRENPVILYLVGVYACKEKKVLDQVRTVFDRDLWVLVFEHVLLSSFALLDRCTAPGFS